MNTKTKKVAALIFIIGGLAAIPFLEWPKTESEEQPQAEQVVTDEPTFLGKTVGEIAREHNLPVVNVDVLPQDGMVYFDQESGMGLIFKLPDDSSEPGILTINKSGGEETTYSIRPIGRSIIACMNGDDEEPVAYIFTQSDQKTIIMMEGEKMYIFQIS